MITDCTRPINITADISAWWNLLFGCVCQPKINEYDDDDDDDYKPVDELARVLLSFSL